ncbi:unnamed protein product [Amoebophrya sp. A25]|nr:unnamed protein product [Amoebophrya sp. A25]|eukprot:GSA25T00010105001.1
MMGMDDYNDLLMNGEDGQQQQSMLIRRSRSGAWASASSGQHQQGFAGSSGQHQQGFAGGGRAPASRASATSLTKIDRLQYIVSQHVFLLWYAWFVCCYMVIRSIYKGDPFLLKNYLCCCCGPLLCGGCCCRSEKRGRRGKKISSPPTRRGGGGGPRNSTGDHDRRMFGNLFSGGTGGHEGGRDFLGGGQEQATSNPQRCSHYTAGSDDETGDVALSLAVVPSLFSPEHVLEHLARGRRGHDHIYDDFHEEEMFRESRNAARVASRGRKSSPVGYQRNGRRPPVVSGAGDSSTRSRKNLDKNKDVDDHNKLKLIPRQTSSTLSVSEDNKSPTMEQLRRKRVSLALMHASRARISTSMSSSCSDCARGSSFRKTSQQQAAAAFAVNNQNAAAASSSSGAFSSTTTLPSPRPSPLILCILGLCGFCQWILAIEGTFSAILRRDMTLIQFLWTLRYLSFVLWIVVFVFDILYFGVPSIPQPVLAYLRKAGSLGGSGRAEDPTGNLQLGAHAMGVPEGGDQFQLMDQILEDDNVVDHAEGTFYDHYDDTVERKNSSSSAMRKSSRSRTRSTPSLNCSRSTAKFMMQNGNGEDHGDEEDDASLAVKKKTSSTPKAGVVHREQGQLYDSDQQHDRVGDQDDYDQVGGLNAAIARRSSSTSKVSVPRSSGSSLWMIDEVMSDLISEMQDKQDHLDQLMNGIGTTHRFPERFLYFKDLERCKTTAQYAHVLAAVTVFVFALGATYFVYCIDPRRLTGKTIHCAMIASAVTWVLVLLLVYFRKDHIRILPKDV